MTEDKIKRFSDKNLSKSKYCPECGAENVISAEFCSECGTKIQGLKSSNNGNVFNKLSSWWNNRSKKGKAVTGFMSCCFGVFLFLFLVALLNPITALTIENQNIQIDDKTTEVVIKGTSEANATVNITAADLNITEALVNVDPTGKFEYKLKIPIETTETKVTVKSQVKGKSDNYDDVTIQRPVTPLTVSQPAKIDDKTENVTIEGDSDPQSTVTINSNELNLKDVAIHPDSNGHFKYVIQVPLNVTGTTVSLNAVSQGKRKSNVLTVNIKRDIPKPVQQQPAPTPEPTPEPKQPANSAPNTDKSNIGTSNYNPTPTKTYGSYIGNSNPSGKYKFHHSWCASVKQMNEGNKVFFNSREEAIAAGYNPCLKCNP